MRRGWGWGETRWLKVDFVNQRFTLKAMVVSRGSSLWQDLYAVSSPSADGAASESISSWTALIADAPQHTLEDAYSTSVYSAFSTDVSSALCYTRCDSSYGPDAYGSGLSRKCLDKVYSTAIYGVDKVYSTGIYHGLKSCGNVVPFDVGEPSARTVARQAASDLSVSLSGAADLLSDSTLALELRAVRDRHSLDQREHFYAFLTEIERRFNSQPLVATVRSSFATSTVITCSSHRSWRSAALS